MSDIKLQQLFTSLKQIQWDVVGRTYGNNHATLIGILVNWWISRNKEHWALEGGPSNGYKNKGTRGQCDALLCSNNSPIGVLEVEGSRHSETVRKIGYFFRTKCEDIKGIRFGIIFLYTYECQGRGDQRSFLPAAVPKALSEVEKVTRENKGKPIIVITMDKKYNRNISGVRLRNEYYRGQPNLLEGRFYQDGVLLKHIILWKNSR